MELAQKKDYVLVSIIGVLFPIFAIPLLINAKFSFWKFTPVYIISLVIFFAIFANFALWVASSLGKIKFIFWQFAKFGASGALTTMVDLGVLNFLIILSGIDAHTAEFLYPLFKSISFIAAATNGYLWNKYWVFETRSGATVQEFGQFVAVSLIGLGINVSIAWLVVNFTPENLVAFTALAGFVAPLLATIASLVWNFLGYKFLVFRRKATGVS